MKEVIWSHDYIQFLNCYLRSATIEPASEYKALREEKVDLRMYKDSLGFSAKALLFLHGTPKD